MLEAGLATLLPDVLGWRFGWAPASLRDAAVVTIVCVYVTWRAGSLLRGRQSGREHCSWMEGSRNHHWLQAFTSELEVLSHLLIIISDLK